MRIGTPTVARCRRRFTVLSTYEFLMRSFVFEIGFIGIDDGRNGGGGGAARHLLRFFGGRRRRRFLENENVERNTVTRFSLDIGNTDTNRAAPQTKNNYIKNNNAYEKYGTNRDGRWKLDTSSTRCIVVVTYAISIFLQRRYCTKARGVYIHIYNIPIYIRLKKLRWEWHVTILGSVRSSLAS